MAAGPRPLSLRQQEATCKQDSVQLSLAWDGLSLAWDGRYPSLAFPVISTQICAGAPGQIEEIDLSSASLAGSSLARMASALENRRSAEAAGTNVVPFGHALATCRHSPCQRPFGLIVFTFEPRTLSASSLNVINNKHLCDWACPMSHKPFQRSATSMNV